MEKKQELIEYIKENLLYGQTDIDLKPDDDLLATGLVDSIGMMKLVSHIENTYNITVPPQDMTIEYFMTVDAISDYLEQQKV